MKQYFSKKILEILIMGTLSVLLFFCLKLPGITFLLVLLVPLPLLILAVHEGFFWVLGGGIWCATLIFLLLGSFESVLYLSNFFPLSCCIGLQIRGKHSINKAVFSAAVLSFALTFILLKTSPFLFHMDLWSSFFSESSVTAQINRTLDFYKSLGMQEEQIKVLKEFLQGTFTFIEQALPSLLLCFMAGLSWLNYRVALWLLKRTGWPKENLPTFSEWRVPDYWIWGLIVGFFVFLAGQEFKEDILFRIGLNLLTSFTSLYFMLGMAIAMFFFEKWQLSYLLRFLVVVLTLYQPFFALLVTGLGAFDFWFDFRKRPPKTA